jgi:hypothetical protein
MKALALWINLRQNDLPCTTWAQSSSKKHSRIKNANVLAKTAEEPAAE